MHFLPAAPPSVSLSGAEGRWGRELPAQPVPGLLDTPHGKEQQDPEGKELRGASEVMGTSECVASPQGHPPPGRWLGTALPRQPGLWNSGCAPERMALTSLLSPGSHQGVPPRVPQGSTGQAGGEELPAPFLTHPKPPATVILSPITLCVSPSQPPGTPGQTQRERENL